MPLSPRVAVALPPNFAAAPQKTRNLTELTRTAAGAQTAYVAITTEKRADHAEAVRRLSEIAGERDGNRKYVEICGWPALEQTYTKRLAHVQAGDEPGKPEAAAPVVNAVTIAIAEGDTIVRFEGTLPPGMGPQGLADILGIAHGATCSKNPQPDEPKQTIQRLQQQLQIKPHTSLPPPAAPRLTAEKRLIARPAGFTRGARLPSFSVGPGLSELQVTTSDTGQIVIVSSNGGTSFSNDYGDSFTASTVNANINKGDPITATGASGNFYVGGISFGATACVDVVAVDTAKNGQTFNVAGNAVSCPLNGSTCLPDQPFLAADGRNGTAKGDQLYVVWRNFPGGGPCTGITSGNPTPTIVCSSDGGKTWGNQTAVGSGDRGRITVGKDGFVYVTWVSGGDLMINKYSSCANGLQVQPHFPIKVDSFSGPDCPIDGLFDNSGRCTSDTEASPQAAVSDELSNDVFVAFAAKTSGNNDDIVVRHSRDGGLTWPDRAVANNAVAAHRFMPWICTTSGVANVSWYDRRAATASDDSLTGYFFSQLSFFTNPPSQLGNSDLNASQETDSQKSINLGTFDPKFGDYNGNACARDRAFLAFASSTAPPGVTNPGGVNVYVVAQPPGPPIVSSVSPNSGKCKGGPTSITVKGSNFYNVSGVAARPLDIVYTTATPLTNVSVTNSHQLTATVPGTLQAGVYEIVVQTPSGGSTQPVISNRTDLFSVGATVTNISPNAGPVPGGTAITITGTCFDAPGLNPNYVTVSMGGKPAPKGYDQCASSTQCTVYTPAATGPGPVDVIVTVDGAPSPTTTADRFTYQGPFVGSITPNHGPKTGGTSVLINGGGFPPYLGTGNNMQVNFGANQVGVLCLGNVQFATSECSGTTPPGNGTVDVIAHAFGASSQVSPGDKFTYDPYPALVQFQLPSYGSGAAVFLNGYAPSGGAPVQVTSSDPLVQLPQATVTIPQGKTVAQVPMNILPTAVSKQVTLTATYQGSTASAIMTVAASPPLSVVTPGALGVNQSGNVQVSLNVPAPNNGALIALTSSDPTAIGLPQSNTVTIPGGSYSASFPISNTYGGKVKGVKISASYNGASASDFVWVPSEPCQEPPQCPKGTSWDFENCACRGKPLGPHGLPTTHN